MLFFPSAPFGIRFTGEDRNTPTLSSAHPLCALCASRLLALVLTVAYLSLFLLLLSFNSELREIFHSFFDRCQIDSRSSFQLNCLGETKFFQEKSNLDDKCQDVPDGTTGGILFRLPAHVPGGLSVPYSYWFMVDPNRNLEIQMKFLEVSKKKN